MQHQRPSQFVNFALVMTVDDLPSFLRFCASKDPCKKYDYDYTDRCAIGQWMKEVYGLSYHGMSRFEPVASQLPHTFGALTERLKLWEADENALLPTQYDIEDIELAM